MSDGTYERKQFFVILVICLVGFFILSVVGVLRFSLSPGLRSSYAGAEGVSAPATPTVNPKTAFPSIPGGLRGPRILCRSGGEIEPCRCEHQHNEGHEDGREAFSE